MAETRSLGSWLGHLERLHPIEIDLGLQRIAQVAQLMQLLPVSVPTISVAGTNGKGSVVYMSDALLRAHGRRTGRYTSPHLLRFNERIVIDDEPASDALIVAAFEAIEAARGDISLTYFEFATLAALWVFRNERVDIIVLEVGLGGRLDAVNIVDSNFCVITAIDLDHQRWLGDTVEEIAPEKAAIAREGRPAVLAEREYPQTLYTTLAEIGADVQCAGQHWQWQQTEGPSFGVALELADNGQGLVLPVPEGLRAANTAAAAQVAALALGGTLDGECSRTALAHLRVPGRQQRLWACDRELVLDVAHNPASMAALVEFLRAHPNPGTTVAALGVMGDKNLAAMATLLATAVDGVCALAISGIDRAESPEVIWAALDAVGIAIAQAEFTVETVWEQLLEGTEAGDRIVVCGSFHTVADIMEYLGPQPAFPAPKALEMHG
ncbi:MAG: dihydrofolate synthase/folylpolyglutamate synthase [Halieaceae bacterium]|jgi:dihydrofolate synthase/folylpolyglutamate synthase